MTPSSYPHQIQAVATIPDIGHQLNTPSHLQAEECDTMSDLEENVNTL